MFKNMSLIFPNFKVVTDFVLFFKLPHSLNNCLKPASIIALEMNYHPLPEEYGAPLRLRIENQLGYKMVKQINKI